MDIIRAKKILALSCLLQNLIQQCPAFHKVWLCGVLPITQSDSAVYCLTQSLTQRYPAFHKAVVTTLWIHFLCKHFNISVDIICMKKILAVSCLLQNLNQRCPAFHKVWLCSVLPITQSDSAVSCLSQSLTLRCPAYYKVWLIGVLPSTKPDSAVYCLMSIPLSQTPLLSFMGTASTVANPGACG